MTTEVGLADVDTLRQPRLSLFYFGNAGCGGDSEDKYKLLLDAARAADEFGFSAVWTPERHFHPFGGLFPNPSVLSAALAVQTRKIGIRAGSVVLPLHDPIRVAEEWSIVDNLSGGRVGVAFASGWQIDDFVIRAENYRNRKAILFSSAEMVRRLWRGEPVLRRELEVLGMPCERAIITYPRPIQVDLPIWIATGGDTEVFRRAGDLGANVLTHFIGQTHEKLRHNIREYRAARAQAAVDQSAGTVTVMMHTLAGDSLDSLKDVIKPPLTEYLRSFDSLGRNLRQEERYPTRKDQLRKDDLRLAYGVERYINAYGLFGSVSECRQKLRQMKEIGADEIACLVDFGVSATAVFKTLETLSQFTQNQ